MIGGMLGAALLILAGARWTYVSWQTWCDDYERAEDGAGFALSATSAMGGAIMGVGFGLLAWAVLA